jgi:Flp pilus assembly protein TadG
MSKHSLRSDRGASLLETALIVPFLTLVLFGVAEIGRIAYAAIEVSNAARAGAAYGAQNHVTAQQTGTIASGTNDEIDVAAVNEAPNITDLTATSSFYCVCQTVDTSTGAVTTTSISCSTAGTACGESSSGTTVNMVVEYVDVNTQATVSTLLSFPGIPNSFNLTGSAQMRVAQ